MLCYRSKIKKATVFEIIDVAQKNTHFSNSVAQTFGKTQYCGPGDFML